MPHFICRWPGGDVLLASVDSRQELDTILQERCEPGVCKVARYHGPLVLELKPDVPGVSRASAERFRPGPACPGFQPAWETRQCSADVELLAGDGSCQRVHKLVLQCRLPVLQGQPVPAEVEQVRLSCVPDRPCLHSLVQFLYLDDVQQQAELTPQLHVVALACNLQRLVDLCEARFAQQLELQLLSWQGLSQERRHAVLDSFIGWCLHCEQLQRQELRQLCVHALARHVAVAQSRPSWSSLSEATSSMIQLIAASTAPPLIHRQLAPDGSAVLPASHNPAPVGMPAAGGPVVSVDAEAFAAAGGRLTSLEWQQLQKFRSAVAGSLQAQEASPILVEQQQLSSSLSAAVHPHMAFAVKQPVLGPHKRLMDSVCRFAFPATHGLLASGWQCSAASPAPVATPATSAGVPAAAATPRPAAVATPVSAPATAQAVAEATAASPAAGLTRQHAVQQEPAAGEAPAGELLLPVPVPVPVPESLEAILAAAAATAAAVEQPEEPLGEEGEPLLQAAGAAPALAPLAAEQAEHSSGSTQHPLQHPAASALLAEQSSMRVSSTGQNTSVQQAAPGSPAAPSSAAPGSQVAGRYLLRSRVHSGSSPGSRRSSHRLRSEARGSWGSGVSLAGAEAQAVLQQVAEQQQQPSGATGAQGLPGAALALPLPLPMLRLLQEGEHSASWGSGAISRQSSLPVLQLPGSAVEAQGPQQQQQQLPGAAHALVSQLAQAELELRVAAQQQQQQISRQQGSGSFSEVAEAALDERAPAQRRGDVQMQHLLGEAVSGVGAGAAGAPGHAAAGGASRHSRRRLLDLPALSIPGAAAGGTSSSDHAATAGAAAGQDNSSGGQLAPASTVAGTAGLGIGSAAAAVAASVPSSAAKLDPLGALQRALVEDFVLYEEASAARQHVVGILVSIEQGDVAAGQRLLEPACAELIAATAPAAVPNRLPLSAMPAGVDEAVAAAAAAKAAGEYLQTAKGISKLLGMASVSRAALEPLPTQVQRQQQLLLVLQRIGSQLPGLLRLLASHSPAAAAAAGTIAGAGGGAPGEAMEVEGAGAAEGPGTRDAAAVHSSAEPQQQRQQEAAAPGSREVELEAVLSDLVQLPELAQGLPVLLTAEQHQQRQLQLHHLARRAAAMIVPEDSRPAGTEAAGNAATGAGAGAAVSAGAPAAQPGGLAPAAVPAAASTTPTEIQAGLLFSSILASLGAAGGATSSIAAVGSAGIGPPGRVQGRLGAGISQLGALPGAAAAAAGGHAAAGSAAAAAGSGLPPGLHTGPLGLLGAGGAPGPADGLMAAALGHPAAATGGSSAGMFTPTGVGAMLSGGLLAEGGVAGDSILEDVAADMLLYGGRRITCHGMYELCAALAGHGSPPHPQLEQPADAQAAGVSDSPAVENAAGAGCGLAGHKRRMSASGAEEQPARKR